jgi:hypothetical protein
MNPIRPSGALLMLLMLATSACAVARETSDPNAGIPQVAAVCAPGTPDCEDTVVVDSSDDLMVEPEVTDDAPDPSTSTDASNVATPLPHPDADFAVVYMLVEAPTITGISTGLIPVARPLAVLSSPVTDLVATTVAFLLVGPTLPEQDGSPSLATAIPEGTRLRGVSVDGGIATIDLSSQFAAPSGTFGEAARLEQVIFTLTRFEDIDAVNFSIEGEPVNIFGGHGIELHEPADRTRISTAVSAILIDSPAYWGVAANPLVASGSTNVCDGALELVLADADGLILWEGSPTVACGAEHRGDWSISIPYDIDEAQIGALIVWEQSDQDWSQPNIREHPVFLSPKETD